MIQRIQSLFLLLASGVFFALFGVDFASSDASAPGIFADKLYNIMDNPILIGLAVLGGALALVNIFLFRNRSLQMRLGYLLMVLSILLPVLAILLMLNDGGVNESSIDVDDGLGIYLPILALILAILANRFIKKDNNLVKSMDRLR